MLDTAARIGQMSAWHWCFAFLGLDLAEILDDAQDPTVHVSDSKDVALLRDEALVEIRQQESPFVHGQGAAIVLVWRTAGPHFGDLVLPVSEGCAFETAVEQQADAEQVAGDENRIAVLASSPFEGRFDHDVEDASFDVRQALDDLRVLQLDVLPELDGRRIWSNRDPLDNSSEEDSSLSMYSSLAP